MVIEAADGRYFRRDATTDEIREELTDIAEAKLVALGAGAALARKRYS